MLLLLVRVKKCGVCDVFNTCAAKGVRGVNKLIQYLKNSFVQAPHEKFYPLMSFFKNMPYGRLNLNLFIYFAFIHMYTRNIEFELRKMI